MFEEQNLHKVLFVTKSDNVEQLLQIKPHNQVVISFSLNAAEVAERWERSAPSLARRIEAARKLYQDGYEIRVRIDPLVPVENWGKYYANLLADLFNNFVPSRITLGSLRGLQSTINNCSDKSWVSYLKENSNWGKKVDSATRFEMYSSVINKLQNEHSYSNVALCKETIDMWGRLGMDYKQVKCNCIL
jgi:spore photoproduct lyase